MTRDQAHARIVDANSCGQGTDPGHAWHLYQAPSWAWPLAGAGEAYINTVGTETICKEVRVPPNAWDAIAELWCEAFVRGYREARAADEGRDDGAALDI